MWRHALASYSKMAVRKSAPPLRAPPPNSAPQPLANNSGLKNIAVHSQSAASTLFANAELLQHAEQDLAFVVGQMHLQHSLQRKPKIYRNLLVSSTQQATAKEALHNVAALLSAGKTDDIAQIVNTWEGSPARMSLRQRVQATRRFTRSVAAVAQIRDATTLRSFLTILASACDATSTGRPTLMTSLGKKRTQLVKMQTTAALCRLSEADGVSVMEKLYWIEQCASPTTVLEQEQLLVPFSLYTILREITESAEASEQGRNSGESTDGAAQHSVPNLMASVVSPFQADVASLVTLPQSELRKMRNSSECTTPTAFTASTNEACSPAAARLLQRVVGTSGPLQVQERNAALIRAMTHCPTHARRTLPPADLAARRELIKLLKGRRRHARHAVSTRDACRSIIANPQLMAAMNLSPTVVFACYLRAFHSVDTVNPLVAKTSAAVVPRLCGRRLYETAAYVSWNHLSTSCESVDKAFRKNPHLLDASVGAVSLVMQKNIANGNQRKWMGHRSIALLCAAAKSIPVTPMHCIPICAGAIGLGVHYASVEEALRILFPDDKDTVNWTLDIIRLCVPNGEHTVKKSTALSTRLGVSQLLSTLLRNARQVMCSTTGGRNAAVSVATPSRSKQLALWQALRDPSQNPVLKSLTLALFTDEACRQCLRDGTLLLSQGATRNDDAQTAQNEKSLEQLMTWEVLASIATNCTSDALYSEMVESLTSRRLPVRQSFATNKTQPYNLGDKEKMRKILQSEMDEDTYAKSVHTI